MTSQTIYVEVFDNRVTNYPALKTVIDDLTVIFIYDKDLAKTLHTNFGVFVDEYALSNAVFRYPRNRRAALLQESPTRKISKASKKLSDRFDFVFTFEKTLLAQGLPFRELFYGTSWINRGRPSALGSYLGKKNLCTFVGSIAHGNEHGYELRKVVADWAISNPSIEAWGRGIREFDIKDSILAESYFSISMENTQVDWYFSEKLIDCFVTDTIPIYWGCSGITRFFDSRGILQFNDLNQLKNIVKDLSVDLYQEMLPYAMSNKLRAFEMGLTGHETLCQRLAEQLIEFGASETITTSLGPAMRTKLSAGLRKLIG